MEEMLTVKETAARLGVSRVKVWRLVKEGALESRVNPLDRRERLIPVQALEQLESFGKRKRPR